MTGCKIRPETGCKIRPRIETNTQRYSRLPDSVLLDQNLTPTARLVYAYLARHVFQGSVTSVGQRRIAGQLGIDKTTVIRALKELSDAHHIIVSSCGEQRHSYILTSPVFAQKSRNGEREIGIGPSGGKRLVSVPRVRIA